MTRSWALTGAAVFAAALAACSHHPQAILDPSKARQAYAVGQRLAAQDRRQQAEHRAAMAKIIDAKVLQTHDHGRTISLYVRIRNKAAKTVKSLDAGIEVHDNKSGVRLGLSEIHFTRLIPPRTSIAFWYPMRYVRFDENAGTMRLAAGKPKTVRMDVTEIKYTDGSDAGYDD